MAAREFFSRMAQAVNIVGASVMRRKSSEAGYFLVLRNESTVNTAVFWGIQCAASP